MSARLPFANGFKDSMDVLVRDGFSNSVMAGPFLDRMKTASVGGLSCRVQGHWAFFSIVSIIGLSLFA
jgi:hypothetical protein